MSETQEQACPLSNSEEDNQPVALKNEDSDVHDSSKPEESGDKPSETGCQSASGSSEERAGEVSVGDDNKKCEGLIKPDDGQEQTGEPRQTEAVISESGEKEESKTKETEDKNKSISIGTVTSLPTSEAQEVSSSITGKTQRTSSRSVRRSSYQGARAYAGGFQNYGLTYLPYKSNFEPSEDARRRADEFIKTLKL